MKLEINAQNTIFDRGMKVRDFTGGENNGRVNMIRMEKRRATTPPSLLGIDRRIAYAKRKYHSGWMWTGVTRGLAGMKFSGSPNLCLL